VVTPGKPAALAGIQAGDSIATLNGQPLQRWEMLLDTIGASAGRRLELGIVRKGQPLHVDVTPAAEMVPDPRTGVRRSLGRIGMVATEGFTPISVGQAFGEAWNLTVDNGSKIFAALGARARRRRLRSRRSDRDRP